MIMLLESIFILAVLFIMILLYFKIADRFNIIDKPNERSSHTSVTLRGGGIIFPLALLLWFLGNDFDLPYLTLGVLLIATISFLDDIITLSAKPRLFVHLISVLLVLYQLDFLLFPWWIIIVGLILIIGWLNTFNFMDGINGITVLYAASILLPLAYLNLELKVIDQSLYSYIGLSLVVFGFFNIRKRAKTFAGDVGSISLGLILAFLLIGQILTTGNWEYILFVSLYGIDSVITILQRLNRKENIFQAHRSHLYQYLANERKIPHNMVSVAYAFLQLAFSFGLILMVPSSRLIYTLISFLLVCIVYFPIKRWAKGGINE